MSGIKVMLHYHEVQSVIEELGKIEAKLKQEKKQLQAIGEKLGKLCWQGENAETYYHKLKKRESALEESILKLKKIKEAIIAVAKNLNDAEEFVQQLAKDRAE